MEHKPVETTAFEIKVRMFCYLNRIVFQLLPSRASVQMWQYDYSSSNLYRVGAKDKNSTSPR